MTSAEALRSARALLESVTPLRRDCGKACGAACCQPDADGQGGMLLFPGEEAFYTREDSFAKLSPYALHGYGGPLFLLTCDGACDRAARPLACRLFPLVPIVSGTGFSLAMDVRAWPVCPLMEHGLAGLSRQFVEKAREAVSIVWEDAGCRAFLAAQSRMLARYTEMAERFLPT